MFNTCSNSLSINEVCFIDIKLIYSSSLSYSPINVNLTSDSSNLNFGKIVLLGQKEQKTAVKLYQFINIGQVLSLINSNKYVRVYVKNEGDKVSNPQITVPHEYTISKTDCISILQKDKVCFIDLKISDSIDPNVIGVNKQINFDGISFSIKAGVIAPNETVVCSPNYSYINETCLQTNQTRSCTAQPTYSYNGAESSNNGGQTWGSCTGYSCNNGYIMSGSQCVPEITQFGTYKAWTNDTYAKTCNEYKNPVSTVGSYTGSTGDGIYRIKPGTGTAFDAYCDMTNDGGGWTLLASSSQANVSYPFKSLPTSLSNAISTNFNNYSTAIFGTGITTSDKKVILNNVSLGVFPYSATKTWWYNSTTNISLRPNWSRYTTSSVWMITELKYATMTAIPGIGGPNHGSAWCNTNDVALYMHSAADSAGGVHTGNQMSQGACNDGVTWKDNFSWQVYTK